MLTKMTGTLARVTDDEARLEVGPLEYAVLVPEAVRRQLQFRVGHELALHIFEYYEGNQTGSRLLPRKVGFLTEHELDFFELFCTVDKVGVKKALKAMARPVKEIAEAVVRQDVRWLSTLPGIGAATAEAMVAALRKKATPFTVAPAAPAEAGPVADIPEPSANGDKPKRTKKPAEPAAPPAPAVDPRVIDDVYQMLMAWGLNPVEARLKLDALIQSGRPFATHEEAFKLIFAKG